MSNTNISVWQGIKEIGAFLTTTLLSCGPSQCFGCIKLIVDACLLKVNYNRRSKINLNIQKIQNDWNAFKASPTISHIATKLRIESKNVTQESARNYFNTKYRKVEEKISKLYRSIRADAYALIPLAGAHISWRVATEYKGKSFTPIFSHAIEQLLEHFRVMVSRPLFLGRISKAINVSEGDSITVSTSTKDREIQIYHNFAREIDAEGNYIINQQNSDREKRATVVLFHPNMGGASDMAQSANFYRRKGYNTLAVTLGGYPGSPGVTTSEKSMYQDIEAIKGYLANIGVTEVGYHGFSLGSGAAFQAAVGESLIKNLKTLFVVVDQPFTSAAAVGGNIFGPLGRGFMRAGCPIGLDVELPGGYWTKTDGLDNLSKAIKLKKENIPLICCETEQDSFMGRKKKDGKYTENFAKDLLAARYGDTLDWTENLVTRPGEHGSNSLRFRWDNDPIPSRYAKS